jgi:hypothetical protein
LPLSRQTLDYTAGAIRHRKRIGSLWRKLNPGRQALLVLAYLPKGETSAEFGVSTATAAGHAYLVIDGTLIPIDRVAADRPFRSGKHRKHGMNLQVIASPAAPSCGSPGRLPGAVHDLTAARIWGIVR